MRMGRRILVFVSVLVARVVPIPSWRVGVVVTRRILVAVMALVAMAVRPIVT